MGFVDFSSIHDIWLINSMEQIPQFFPRFTVILFSNSALSASIYKISSKPITVGISSPGFIAIIRAVLIQYVVLAMANKKLLICAALATGLLLTACVKKEEPKEEQQEQATETQTTQPQPEPEKIQEFESLESTEPAPPLS